MAGFNWDSANINHIARHDLTHEQVEQVIQNDPVDVARYLRNGEERLHQVGETDDGLVLVVITTVRRDLIRVVTAHMTANWWDSPDGRAEILKGFEQAKQEGTLGRGTLKKRGLTPPITIRLDPKDVELARLQAEERGLRYQTYLRMVIHQALQREATK